MDPVELVREHGLLLESAKGSGPSLAELIAGEPITGSWWSHPHSHAIFDAITRCRDSPDVVALRLVRGKITLVHRRLWPALVRLADELPESSLAAVEEAHTASGAHRAREVPFPDWVPEHVRSAGGRLSVEEAEAQLPVGVPPRG